MHCDPSKDKAVMPHLARYLLPSSLFSNGTETFISWGPQKERGSLGFLGLTVLQNFASLPPVNYKFPF